MKLTDLLEEFNVVIDTAEGLTELRSLILGLAVRGKLVPQDPNDESASVLLKKIEAEKKLLYEEGEIRKPKKFPSVVDREIPFEIPESWIWCRLGDIYGDIGTTTPESKFSYIDVSSIDNTSFEIDYSKVENISAEDAPSRARREVQEESVIYSTVRPYLNNVAIVKNSFDYKPIASTAFEVITVFEGILNKYVYRYLLSDPFLDYVNFKMVGVAYPAINKGDMKSAIISIPPTAEQHRIVKRIEALFAEVDELEAKLDRQTILDEKLQLAVNAEVQQAPDAKSSKSAWNFITSNFETLYHTPEAIDNLKKNILNEAVRGRLVPQNLHDVSASELLKKIEAEKDRLYEDGEIRKPKKLPPVKDDEIPFEIPGSWEWCRFGDFCRITSSTRIHKKDYVETGIPFFRSKEIGELSQDSFVEPNYYIKEKLYSEIKSSREVPKPGDLLVTSVGSLGNTWIVDDREFYFKDGNVTHLIQNGKFSSKFVKFVINSPLFMNQVHEIVSGTAYNALTIIKFKKMLMAFPPLEEQHRIVQRIEELFVICDRFKSQLKQRQAVNERLVKGLVGEVLENSSN